MSMTLLRQILRAFVVLLVSVLGASMAFAVPMVTSDNAYFHTETTHFVQRDDVGFAARAPPMAVSNVAATGGVTVMHGGAFALGGQETVAALYSFDGDHNATNSVRSVDELLPNGRVPSVRNGEFNQWFDDLSPAELDTLWTNPTTRSRIEARIRQPGGLHEWCMACRAPEFRRWGVPMDEIQRFRTRTGDLTWTHPTTGVRGGHGADGSGQFHNELRDIIDNSTSLDQFNSGVTALRDRWQIDPSLLPDLPIVR